MSLLRLVVSTPDGKLCCEFCEVNRIFLRALLVFRILLFISLVFVFIFLDFNFLQLCLIVSSVKVFVVVEVFVHCPSAEFLEQDLAAAVGVDLRKSFLGVVNLDSPFREHVNRRFELFNANAVVFARVNGIEGGIELDILPHHGEENSKFLKVDESIIIVVLFWGDATSCFICHFNCWLH